MNDNTNTAIHPKAAAAEEQAKKRAQTRDQCKADIKRMRELGVRFLSVGPVTVAYRIEVANVVAIGTAIRKKGDKDDEYTGKCIAGSRLLLSLSNNCPTLLRVKIGRHSSVRKLIAWAIQTLQDGY